MKTIATFLSTALLSLAIPVLASDPDLNSELAALTRDNDIANYEISSKEAKLAAIKAIGVRADALAKKFPDRAEPLFWQARVLMVQAGINGGLSARGLMYDALDKLEAASKIPTNTLVVDTYTTLGLMYGNAPGFPLAFGDKKKSHANFKKALELDPNGLGVNIEYAKVLFKFDDYAGALKYATAAVGATARPGRDKADKAAFAKAQELIAQSKAKLK
jgi:tetratricopeptide (TPR) repeat protein